MTYVNHMGKEHMQDDTFKIIARRIDEAAHLIETKNTAAAYNKIDIIYIMCSRRIDKKDPSIQEILDNIDKNIYGKGKKTRYELSATHRMVRDVFKKICHVLDQEGILYKMQEKSDNAMYR